MHHSSLLTKRLLLIFLGIGLTACQLAPKPPEAALAKQAAETALSAAIQINTLIADCQRLSSTLKKEMHQLQDFWWQQNGSIVASSDHWYKTQIKQPLDLTSPDNLPTIHLLFAGQDSGHKIINNHQRFYAAKERKCSQIARSIQAGSSKQTVNLTLRQDLAPAYAYFNYTYPENPVPYRRVPSAINPRIKISNSNGRFRHQAEDFMEPNSCAQLEVVLIGKEGPLEHYAGLCPNQTEDFMVLCDWGQCERL